MRKRDAIKILCQVGLWEKRLAMPQKSIIHRDSNNQYMVINLKSLQIRKVDKFPKQNKSHARQTPVYKAT